MTLRQIYAKISKIAAVSIDMRQYTTALDKAAYDLWDAVQDRKDRAKGKSYDVNGMLEAAKEHLPDNDSVIEALEHGLTADLAGQIAYDILKLNNYELRELRKQFSDYEDAQGTEELDKFDVSHLVAETEKNASDVADLVSAAMDRAQVTVPVVVVPQFYDKSVPESGSTTFSIDFGDNDMFTVFLNEDGTIEVDDLMEGGTDDFVNPKNEGPYFLTVNELRTPGSTSKSKRIKLYTARPKKDREQFNNMDTLPINLFLSSSESDAEGIAVDGDRDLYMVVTDQAYLVQTLNTPNVKHYQVVKEGAPVYTISRLSE